MQTPKVITSALNSNEKSEFIKLLLEAEALKFGSFKTKSGRMSPYFFNFGAIASGSASNQLSALYATGLERIWQGERIDILFGPAYKGIPLCVGVAGECARRANHNQKISFSYNRKEKKDHGEGGSLVGGKLSEHSRVVIIEDVLTGGTSLRETMELFRKLNIPVLGALVGVNRQERGLGKGLASEEIERAYNIPVHSLITLDEIVEGLKEKEVAGKVWIDRGILNEIQSYRQQFGGISS